MHYDAMDLIAFNKQIVIKREKSHERKFKRRTIEYLTICSSNKMDRNAKKMTLSHLCRLAYHTDSISQKRN